MKRRYHPRVTFTPGSMFLPDDDCRWPTTPPPGKRRGTKPTHPYGKRSAAGNLAVLTVLAFLIIGIGGTAVAKYLSRGNLTVPTPSLAQ